VAQRVVGDLLLQLVHEDRPLGPRPDEAHVAPEDVPELRQLVDARLAHERAVSRHARVVLHGPHGAIPLRILVHRAELDHLELPPALAYALLPVEQRPPRLQPDRHSREKHEGGGDDEPRHREHQIHAAFDLPREARCPEIVGEDEPARSQILHQQFAGEPLGHRVHVLDPHPAELGAKQLADGQASPAIRHADDDPVDRLGGHEPIDIGGRADHARVDDRLADAARIVVDEAHDAVREVLLGQDLPRHRPGRRVGADDEDALVERPPRGRAAATRECPSERWPPPGETRRPPRRGPARPCR
jgi:hypothetical protein